MTDMLQRVHTVKPATPDARRAKGTALILLGIVLIAANLRLSVSATGALLNELGGSLRLGSGVESFLTAVWPLAFAVGGVSASWLARKYTAGTVISWAVGALAIGQLVHSLHDTAALLAGSLLAGLGIALANVLLPVVVRQYFPDRVGPVTGLYAMVLSGGAAFAALASVPVSDHAHNVDAGLAVWVVPAVIALAAWIAARPQRAAHPTNAALAAPAAHLPLRQLAKSPLAWSMALLFGLQSTGAYVVMGWLPTILQDAGLSAGKAGVVLSSIFFIGIPLNYLVPHFGAKMRDRRPLLTALTLASVVSFTGLIIAPASLVWLWAVVLSFGMAIFPLVLALFPVRGGTPEGTAALSTFSQSIGYLIATAAPLGFGLLHDATGSWTVPLLIVVAATVLQGVVGLYVASPRRGSVSDGRALTVS
ncbi:MAG TPA: MFS transporter [Actinospica sp.]|nr:MFS transporter [Actinospica sp.]